MAKRCCIRFSNSSISLSLELVARTTLRPWRDKVWSWATMDYDSIFLKIKMKKISLVKYFNQNRAVVFFRDAW
jgi:hypothetical protein